MTNFQVRAILPYTTGLPGDEVVNTFAVIGPTASALITPFTNFYNVDTGPTTTSIADVINRYVTRVTNGCRFEIYSVDLATGATGSPLLVSPWTLATTSLTTGSPNEVALCTSFASTVPPGVSPARRRGRVYIGPFVDGASGGSLPNRPGTSLVNTLQLATKRLATELVTAGAELAVWSRKDAAMYPVVRGWVDDEWDTMRSRQVEASSRTTWTL